MTAQTFEQHDPRNPQPEHKVLKVFKGAQNESEDFYFIKQKNRLLVYSEDLHTYPLTSPCRPGESALLADQIELPLSAIRWFINVVEQKFFQSPEKGGLPADKLSYEETVAAEDLHVIRSMNAGCSHPGYELTNGSRRGHQSPRNFQCLQLSDPWLFNNGLMDYLKQLAEDYEQGRL